MKTFYENFSVPRTDFSAWSPFFLGAQFSTCLLTIVGVISVVAQVFSHHTRAIVGKRVQNCTLREFSRANEIVLCRVIKRITGTRFRHKVYIIEVASTVHGYAREESTTRLAQLNFPLSVKNQTENSAVHCKSNYYFYPHKRCKWHFWNSFYMFVCRFRLRSSNQHV